MKIYKKITKSFERKFNKKIDSNNCDETLEYIKKLIKSGYSPVDLSILKWKHIIETKNWELGSYWTNCALCIKYNRNESCGTELCKCPLFRVDCACTSDISKFRLFTSILDDYDCKKENFDLWNKACEYAATKMLKKLKHSKLYEEWI